MYLDESENKNDSLLQIKEKTNLYISLSVASIIILFLVWIFIPQEKYLSFKKIIDSILLPVLVSLLAALIYSKYKIKDEDTRLKKIRNISNKDFLEKLLKNLDRFDGTYCEHWHVKNEAPRPKGRGIFISPGLIVLDKV